MAIFGYSAATFGRSARSKSAPTKSHSGDDESSAICRGVGSYEWGSLPWPTRTRTRTRPPEILSTKYAWGMMLTVTTGTVPAGPLGPEPMANDGAVSHNKPKVSVAMVVSSFMGSPGSMSKTLRMVRIANGLQNIPIEDRPGKRLG
jgi:hypothetical protein